MATHLIPVIGKTLFSAPPPSPSSSNTPSTLASDSALSQDKLERERRMEMLRRKRRGVTGTITTSPRGFLASKELAPNRISLLGE